MIVRDESFETVETITDNMFEKSKLTKSELNEQLYHMYNIPKWLTTINLH